MTVSGISFFSNNLNNALLGGIIASVPIGMPTTIFIKNNVEVYTWDLLVMTFVLLLSTFLNWFLINKMRYDKYISVSLSMLLWASLGGIYYFSMKYNF